MAEVRRRARPVAALVAACTVVWAVGGLAAPAWAVTATADGSRSKTLQEKPEDRADDNRAAGAEGELGDEPECPAPDPDATTTTSTTTTTVAGDEDEPDPCCPSTDPDSSTTTSPTTTTTTTPTSTTVPCPDDPTSTTTTVPVDPGATTTVPTSGPSTTSPDTTAPGTTSPSTTVPATTTTPDTTPDTSPDTTTTTAAARPAAPSTTSPTTTIAPTTTTPPAPPPPPAPTGPPPTLPPAIPIPAPAAAPPPVGTPVAPAVADPVADPLADAATLAVNRLHLWQDALVAVTTTQTEADGQQAIAEASHSRVADAQSALAALREDVPPPVVTTGGPVDRSDLAALVTGPVDPIAPDPIASDPAAPDPAAPDPAAPDPLIERRRVLTEELAAARAEQTAVQAQLDELGARLIEDRVIARAAELGHDAARLALADITAARLAPIAGAELDRVWSTTDPRRLDVLYTALRQVGDPYVFYQRGPDRFDCSGLTLYAWQTVGVRLVHYSFSQRGQTPAVEEAQLQPGDLVFNLRPTGGHVMLSLGVENGIVHAPGSGKRVEISRWRKATGFGSPLGPAPVTATATATPLLDTPVAVASQPAVRSVTTANTVPTAGPPAVPTTGPTALDSGATTTITAAPVPTWVGGVAEGARMIDAPDASLYDSAGARYGVDPALLAGRARAVEQAAAASATATAGATRATGSTTTVVTAGPSTVLALTDATLPSGPLALRVELALRLGVDPADPAAATDAAARYLAAAAPLLGGTETALVALDLGAGVVASRGLPTLGPARELLDATLTAAQALRPPPPAPPELPVTILGVVALPPPAPLRMVVAVRRRAA